jgi:hypothetical protein
MTGEEIPAITQGQKLSILFARASSKAPALYGLGKRLNTEGCAGLPGCNDDGGALGIGWSSDGERIGEEKERR